MEAKVKAFLEAIKGTYFEADLVNPMMINNASSSVGMYNLIILKGQVKLYNKGLKPNKYFKITDVKKYFGFKGNNEKLAETLAEWFEIAKNVNFEKSPE